MIYSWEAFCDSILTGKWLTFDVALNLMHLYYCLLPVHVFFAFHARPVSISPIASASSAGDLQQILPICANGHLEVFSEFSRRRLDLILHNLESPNLESVESFSRLRPICWGVAHIFVAKATGSLYSQLSWQKLFIKTRTVGAKPHSLWCFASPPPIPGWNLKARNGKIRRIFTQIWGNPRHLIAFEFFLSDKPKPLYTNFGIPLSSTSPGRIHSKRPNHSKNKQYSDNKTCGKSWTIYNSA